MIIIAAQSHESTTPEESILNHFGVLNNNVKVVKEYTDTTHMLCGHFVLNESKINYDAKKSKEEFKDFKYVFLGHQHTFEIIKPNICHLGSCRYIDFSEVDDLKKIICIIQDYNEKMEQIHFSGLKSPYPMKDIQLQQIDVKNAPKLPLQGTIPLESDRQIASSAQIAKFPGTNPSNQGVSVAKGIQILDKLDPKTKVRVIFHDFESYTQFINNYDFYKNKFVLFKDKKEFLISVNNQKCILTEMKGLKENMVDYLDKAKVNDIIKQILLEEIK
jgi:DNA repair exonuclease SbcCD nuclease subunit